MPFFRAGIVFLSPGNNMASHAKSKHHKDTKANWTSVRVIGLSKAFRIDLEDVLVRADVRYHMTQRTFLN